MLENIPTRRGRTLTFRAYAVWSDVIGGERMDGKKEMKRALEKAHLYGLLAEYYKYRDPELVMHYYQKHFKYTHKVAIMARGTEGRLSGKDEATSPPSVPPGSSSRLRVIHASPDAPVMDVQVDGRMIGWRLTFGQVSNDLLIPGGNHRVELHGTGPQEEPMVSKGISLEPGRSYTLVVVNRLKDLELQLIRDQPEDRERISKNSSDSSLS